MSNLLANGVQWGAQTGAPRPGVRPVISRDPVVRQPASGKPPIEVPEVVPEVAPPAPIVQPPIPPISPIVIPGTGFEDPWYKAAWVLPAGVGVGALIVGLFIGVAIGKR